MPNPIFETRHSGGFVVSENDGYRSRDAGIFVNTGTVDLVLVAGTVLANGAEGNAVVTAGANTGTGTLGGLTFGPGAVIGKYLVAASSATSFTVTDPRGESLPPATVATAYSDAELSFTIAAGGTAFVAGDSFTVAIPAADASYVPWKNANPAVAIAYNTGIVPASSTAKITVLTRAAEVNAAELIYDPAITGSVNPTPTALAILAGQQLRAQGVVFR